MYVPSKAAVNFPLEGLYTFVFIAIGNNKVVFDNFSSCWVEMVVKPHSINIFSVDVSYK